MSFWKNLGKGDVVGAFNNLKDYIFSHLPPQLAAFVNKFMDDEGQIIWGACVTALGDAVAGKTIQQIGDDVWNQIKSQVPTKAKSDVLDALGVLLRAPADASAT